MKKLLTLLIIFALLSCDKKGTTEVNQSSRGQLENAIKGEDPTSDNQLLGKWTMQLSCDGSIMCNQCREISFRADGFVTMTNPVKTFEVMKWEIENGQLKIININNDSIVDNGKYKMKYKTDKWITELELVKVNNSDCYLLTR
jgi:hypothetical protein